MLQASATLLKRRRTKIVATLGPASSEPAVIRQLIEAGVSVFRLNFSHGEHETHGIAYRRVREAAAELREPVAVLADLCGPKIRVGKFADGRIDLPNGDEVVVTTRGILGGPGLIPSQYEALHTDVRAGARILLDDGLMELRVESVDGQDVRCTVVHGGVLRDRKGMNLPDVAVSAPSMSDKDFADASFSMELGVDFLALSFVRRAADVEELRAFIGEAGPQIIAKIEKPEALDDIEAILDASDGIMVARGDLGVELPPEVVPIAQRELVARARAKAKPAIVATQMLESMIEQAQPTRAEVSDVSTAVFSGADAVMLSAETASGRHPLRAVEMMDRIARRVEAQLWSESRFAMPVAETVDGSGVPLHVAVARSTAQLSRDLRVRAIVVFSTTGTTGGVVAAARPAAPVVAATPNEATCRRMNLLWGIVPVTVEDVTVTKQPALARQVVGDLGLAEAGQHILTVSGFAAGKHADEPVIRILTV